MLNSVGELVPFSTQWLDNINMMSKEQAITYLEDLINRTIKARDMYQTMMINNYSDGALNCYCVDSNNIIRFAKLLNEIKDE